MANDKNNTGTLGKNKRKTEDTHPEYAGQAIIDGVEYWVSGWIKANRETGEKFFSLSYKKKVPRGEGQQSRPAPKPAGDQPEGDVPF